MLAFPEDRNVTGNREMMVCVWCTARGQGRSLHCRTAPLAMIPLAVAAPHLENITGLLRHAFTPLSVHHTSLYITPLSVHHTSLYITPLCTSHLSVHHTSLYITPLSVHHTSLYITPLCTSHLSLNITPLSKHHTSL